MLGAPGTCRKSCGGWSSESPSLWDPHCQTAPAASAETNSVRHNILSFTSSVLVLNVLPTAQTSDRCISWRHLAGSPETPGIEGRIHRPATETTQGLLVPLHGSGSLSQPGRMSGSTCR